MDVEITPILGSRFYRAAIWNPEKYTLMTRTMPVSYRCIVDVTAVCICRYTPPQKMNHRKFGRCTDMHQVCSTWNEKNATACYENETHALIHNVWTAKDAGGA